HTSHRHPPSFPTRRSSDLTNALDQTVKTTYVPDDSSYGPLTSKTSTDPRLFTSTTEVDPAWGTATKSTDANGNVTEWAFDALGRSEEHTSELQSRENLVCR